MPRLKQAMLGGWSRGRRSPRGIEPEAIIQDLDPLPRNGGSSPRHLLAALDRLSSAVIASTGSWMFLSSERIQLIDLAHKLAWLLVRLHRSEALLAEVPDIAGTTRAIQRAHHQLESVQALGGGVDAIDALFGLIARIEVLLPPALERPH
ncbi:hypothetical protein [Sphingomonas elodea]|uniref:hypothetical protein n=1 Tax=Sphingomonas elodea TaxID=179878 RepID=UPI00111071A3|nr:hypothetical protein [Sphingomonas elodea]